jgi:hypothetical protein
MKDLNGNKKLLYNFLKQHFNKEKITTAEMRQLTFTKNSYETDVVQATDGSLIKTQRTTTREFHPTRQAIEHNLKRLVDLGYISCESVGYGSAGYKKVKIIK